MVFHSFVISLDAQRTDLQIKSDIDAFFVANGILDTNIKTMAMSRHALSSERYLLVVSAAI